MTMPKATAAANANDDDDHLNSTESGSGQVSGCGSGSGSGLCCWTRAKRKHPTKTGNIYLPHVAVNVAWAANGCGMWWQSQRALRCLDLFYFVCYNLYKSAGRTLLPGNTEKLFFDHLLMRKYLLLLIFFYLNIFHLLSKKSNNK